MTKTLGKLDIDGHYSTYQRKNKNNKKEKRNAAHLMGDVFLCSKEWRLPTTVDTSHTTSQRRRHPQMKQAY